MNLDVAQERSRWLSALIIVVLLLDILIWFTVLNERGLVTLVRVRSSLGFLGCIFLLTATVTAAYEVLKPRAKPCKRLLGALLLLSLVPSLRAFQVYTDLGVFLLDGSEYWIDRAARTRDPARAKEFLAVVVSATQYGVNEAENQVLAHYAPDEQVRLFRLLAEIAPNENWRERFLAHCRTQ